MESSRAKKILSIFIATAAFLPYIACSSQQSNPPSPSTPPNNGSLPPLLYGSSGQAITSCSRDPGTFTDLSMNLMTYTMNGVQTPNWIRVKFNAIPSQFASGTGYLAFFAWTTDGAGNATTPQMVPFYIEKYSGNGNFTAVSNTMSYTSWTSLQNTASSSGVSTAIQDIGVNLTFVIQLSGSLANMTTLQPTFYYNGVSSPSHYVSALIPNFYANPNNYASSHSYTLLLLHPFYSSRNSGYSESQFAALGQALCF